MSGAATVKEPTRRPRDRGQQIAANARELFTVHGYHSVRMDQIAEASGVTARALYRHYASKQALLSHVIHEDQQRLVSALEQLGSDNTATLEDRLASLTEVGLESRRLSVLWQREARHLDRDDFSLVRDRTRWIAEQVGHLLVKPGAPDLHDFAHEVRSWAVVSILTSPAFYDSGLSRAKLKSVLVAACLRVIAAVDKSDGNAGAEMRPVHPRTPASRREQLIAAAAREFRRNGYAGVSIDDIGAEVGVVGPAIYRYFPTKAGILVAATNRFYEWQALEVARALGRPAQDPDVFEAMVEEYVGLAVRAIDLLSVSLTENHYLPQDERDRFERIREENTLEWQRWASAARDDLDEATSLTLVHVCKSIVHDLVRIAYLYREPAFASELRTAVTAVVCG